MNISLATLNDYIKENDFIIYVNHSTRDRSLISIYDENKIYSVEIHLKEKLAFYIHPLHDKSLMISYNIPRNFETWNKKFKRLIFKDFSELAEWLHSPETKDLALTILNASVDDVPLIRNNLEIEANLISL